MMRRPRCELCGGAHPTTAHIESRNEHFEDVEMRAMNVLRRLGVNWSDLKGRDVLEIGAGAGEIGRAAKKRGINYTSLEQDPEHWKDSENFSEEMEYVVASAENIPFDDNHFDLILSHAAPPVISSTKAEASATIKEAVRVLKPGGVFRFGPVYLNAAIFEESELFTTEELESDGLSDSEKKDRIREQALEYLKTIHSSVREVRTEDKRGKEMFVYVLTKPEDEKTPSGASQFGNIF